MTQSTKPTTIPSDTYSFNMLGVNAMTLEGVTAQINKRLQDHDDQDDIRVFIRSLRIQITEVSMSLRRAMQNCEVPKGDNA